MMIFFYFSSFFRPPICVTCWRRGEKKIYTFIYLMGHETTHQICPQRRRSLARPYHVADCLCWTLLDRRRELRVGEPLRSTVDRPRRVFSTWTPSFRSLTISASDTHTDRHTDTGLDVIKRTSDETIGDVVAHTRRTRAMEVD